MFIIFTLADLLQRSTSHFCCRRDENKKKGASCFTFMWQYNLVMKNTFPIVFHVNVTVYYMWHCLKIVIPVEQFYFN